MTLDSPKCFYSFSCENARSSLSLSPAPSLLALLNRSPQRCLTENMRSLITGVTAPAPCLRLCPAATIKSRVTLSVSSRRDICRRERGQRKWDGRKERQREGQRKEGSWKQELKGRGKGPGSVQTCPLQEEPPHQQPGWRNSNWDKRV